MSTDRAPHPSLPGFLPAPGEQVRDREQHWPVAGSSRLYDGSYMSVREDRVTAPDGHELTRQVVEHKGAVGVVVVDDDDRVLLLEQYRHPVAHRLLELPAGVLDVPGESPLEAARRELGEETDLVAEHWEPLVHRAHASPGYTAERWEVFLARGLSLVPDADRTVREGEEADMGVVWVPFDDAVRAALEGRIGDCMTMIGLLAAHAHRLA
ncbi:NUDIX domain-containing protein [Solicola sp. PLA-1-18]|uniref:NUDIX domain-containing protein n=1 Tax=Solicola sp. PLA-1-18 TaxID=3380532 RepID=UPI003B7EAB7F